MAREEKTVEELQVNLETVVNRVPPSAFRPIAFKYNEPSEDALRAIQALKPGESNEAIMRQIFRTYAPANEVILALVRVASKDMQNNPELGLTLQGYTSLKGDEAYDQALSLRRAQALAWLIIRRRGRDCTRKNHSDWLQGKVAQTEPLRTTQRLHVTIIAVWILRM